MIGLFGYRVRFAGGRDHYSAMPPALTPAVQEVEPVVFVAESPFCLDDSEPSIPVVRREGAPEELWWPLTTAISLGLARIAKEWTREIPH